MGFLEAIGIGTIIFIIYKYVIKVKLENVEIENSIYTEKVKILRSCHPEIRELFKKFEVKQRESAEYVKKNNEDSYYVDEGRYVNLFGQPTFVIYQRQIKNFSNTINSIIKELENNPIEKQKIDEIIKKHQYFVKKQNEQSEIKLLEIRKNYLKYKDLMNEIFPDTETKVTRNELIEALKDKFNLNEEEGNRVFKELLNYETGIIFKNPLSKTIETYWYDKRQIKRKI
jgi:hypothetical protein